jgi:hypothetical protein
MDISRERKGKVQLYTMAGFSRRRYQLPLHQHQILKPDPRRDRGEVWTQITIDQSLLQTAMGHLGTWNHPAVVSSLQTKMMILPQTLVFLFIDRHPPHQLLLQLLLIQLDLHLSLIMNPGV